MGNEPNGIDLANMIIGLIDTGQVDNEIEAIIQAAVARRNVLSKMEGARNQVTMKPGDQVRLIAPISPKYLRGVTGKISPRRASRSGDLMVEFDYNVGKFWAANGHPIIGVPASCLELI